MTSQGYWRVKLDDVTLSGGDPSPVDCETGPAQGCLTVPPAGLGMAELRVEDVTYAQRDGVRHFSDWYGPRLITLEGVTVCPDGCPSCPSARKAVGQIMAAWSRRCDDAELVIYTDCHGTAPDPNDRSLVGPYGAVGRPRVAELTWDGMTGCATLTLRFDAIDHRLFVLDECGTPGSGELSQTLELGASVGCRTYDRCYGSADGGQLVNRNRLVNPSASAETAAGWQSGNNTTTSLAFTEDETWVGRGAMVATMIADTGNIAVANPAAARFTVASGETLAAQVHIKPDPAAAPRRARLGLWSADASGTGLGTQYGTWQDVGTDWAPITDLLALPERAAVGSLTVLIETPANGEKFYLDGAAVTSPDETVTTDPETGDEAVTLSVPDYFDGDSTDPGGEYEYAWDGAPNDSTSTKRTTGGTGGWCYDDGETQRGGPGEPVEFSVGGSLCVHPIITFYGTLTDPYIENTETGEKIGYDGTVTALQTVIIDAYEGTATSGGGNVIYRVTGDPHFAIGPGETTLRLVSSGADDDGYAVVSWRPAVGWA